MQTLVLRKAFQGHYDLVKIKFFIQLFRTVENPDFKFASAASSLKQSLEECMISSVEIYRAWRNI